MDIVTHGMMGLALAGPYLGEHPWGACGFVLGSVLPDLDALSRCGGKSAFLRNHQGWTHSFLIILTGSILSYWGLRMVAFEFSGAAIGLGLGALLHSFLDLTNTFGVRAFAPFSSRRYCWEWLFFIDAFIIGITVPTAIYVLLSISQPEWESKRVAMVYGAILAGYVLGRGVMRWRIARRFPPGTERRSHPHYGPGNISCACGAGMRSAIFD
ncbi:MAG: metal-dependent hydrolase [Planctomycetaceae bacterium]|nr:metal-dependent hydrolase [Planctomycetaceae bacterium]